MTPIIPLYPIPPRCFVCLFVCFLPWCFIACLWFYFVLFGLYASQPHHAGICFVQMLWASLQTQMMCRHCCWFVSSETDKALYIPGVIHQAVVCKIFTPPRFKLKILRSADEFAILMFFFSSSIISTGISAGDFNHYLNNSERKTLFFGVGDSLHPPWTHIKHKQPLDITPLSSSSSSLSLVSADFFCEVFFSGYRTVSPVLAGREMGKG